MNFGKRQLVLAALVVALGAAVYINWQFTDNKGLVATTAVSSAKELGQAAYVNNQVSSEPDSQSSAAASSNAASNSASTDYFSQAALSRQQARDAASDALKEIAESAKSTDEAKTKAAEQIGEISKNIEQESNIENLIKAKGYPNCVAFIQNGECNIVVSAPQGLLESDTVIIKDIVSSQSGITYDKIKIVGVK